MINALYSASSAINASNSVASVTANNIANVNTPSFKSKMSVLHDMSNGGVSLSAIKINNQNGYIIPTGNPLDIAILGRRKDDEEPILDYYSQIMNNRFSIDDLGNLRSPQGDILFTGVGGNVRLDTSGNLYSDNKLIGHLQVANNTPLPTGSSILSGYRVGSNVNLADEMVNNMVNLRYLQLNAVTVRTSDEMLGTILNMKG